MDQHWAVTVQLGDPAGRKVATETLNFRSKEAGQQALRELRESEALLKNRVYTIENEEGEQISFLGERYISHSLLNITPIDIEL
jgi:hypothetical protein